MRILLISMLLSFVLTNCPTQEDTDLVEMQAAVNPEEAGEVNPPIGTYISGREITVVTIPANEQWEFTGWTGDTTAQEDSLTFEITENMELTANYEVPAQAFSNQITVTDGNNSKELVFGMHSDATAGFDDGIDAELPQITPPEGAFYRRFNIPDYALRDDYRAIQAQQTVWEMEFAPDEGQTVTLSWDFSESAHIGSLTLTDDPEESTFEIDMKEESSYSVSETSTTILYIVSN